MSNPNIVRTALGLSLLTSVLLFQNCGGGFKTAPLDSSNGVVLLASAAPTPTPGPVGPTPTPPPDPEETFMGIFAALQAAIAGGVSGANLTSIVEACTAAKAVATAQGVDLSAFSCNPAALLAMSPSQASIAFMAAYGTLQGAIEAGLSPAQLATLSEACNQIKKVALVLGVTSVSGYSCAAPGLPAISVAEATAALTSVQNALNAAIAVGLTGGPLAALRSACEQAKTAAAGVGINVTAVNCQM